MFGVKFVTPASGEDAKHYHARYGGRGWSSKTLHGTGATSSCRYLVEKSEYAGADGGDAPCFAGCWLLIEDACGCDARMYGQAY